MVDNSDDSDAGEAAGKDDWGDVPQVGETDPWVRIERFIGRSAASPENGEHGAVASADQTPAEVDESVLLPAVDAVASPSTAAPGRETLPKRGNRGAAADSVFFDTEVFRGRGIEKVGIIGGRGVGKSYLFQAMVYRVQHAPRSGALSYFLDGGGIALAMALSVDEPVRSVNLQSFNTDYERWTRLGTTLAARQPWYRLTLPYRTGIFGRGRAAMEVEFFDGSGEQFFEAKDPRNRPVWQYAYADARVMVFCLPLWVAFPGEDLSLDDWQERESILESFHEVVQNYKDMRRHLGHSGRPVRSILAFTMADDRRGALKVLRERWIAGYLQRHREILEVTRRGGGVARYLANARRVSDILLDELAAADAPGVARIPAELSFGGKQPWLIPVSAVHGEALDQLEADYPNPDERPRREPPVPIHVELPLLVALCEQGNALM
jgi:hypothetical protein